MADDTAKLSPNLNIRKKRSVQFLVDGHLHEHEAAIFNAALLNDASCTSSNDGDNVSIKSTSSSCRLLHPIHSASPRPAGVETEDDDDDEDGSPITICRPPGAPDELAVFEIGLGMLRQHTIYEIQFLLPAAGRLDTEDVEVIRSNVVVPEGGRKFQLSAEVDVLQIDYLKDEDVYKLTLRMTTTANPHLFENFALKSVAHQDQCVYFILRGNALGKGHGTPSLRLGIHQVGHSAEFEESDAKTEWAGFVEEAAGESQE
ncbi:unnamed protein product [Mesocestoides corti]|uniref:Adipose-secreted signaling protein n=1 Tax=Mesocestoides corti TaxID=53468 RepID=A0A0R3UFJ1_MESCO|nr:unnamed protein product [Mesocestoides corti]